MRERPDDTSATATAEQKGSFVEMVLIPQKKQHCFDLKDEEWSETIIRRLPHWEGVFIWKIMIQFNETIHEQIKAHGASTYPHEGCGLLLGRVEDGNNVVTEIRPMENVWPNEEEKPIRFRIDEKAWQQVEIEAMMNDLDVIGIFHSHPDDQPVASPRDLAWASWPGYSYLITQVLKGEPTHSRSWQLKPDRSGFFEEDVFVNSK